MTSTAKPTPGPWTVDRNGLSGYGDNGNTFNIIPLGGSRHGDIIASLPQAFRLLDRDSVEDDDYLEAEATANLIAEAGTVYHETGLTPRELAQQRDEAIALLGEFVDWVRSPHSSRDLSDMTDRGRALLSKTDVTITSNEALGCSLK